MTIIRVIKKFSLQKNFLILKPHKHFLTYKCDFLVCIIRLKLHSQNLWVLVECILQATLNQLFPILDYLREELLSKKPVLNTQYRNKLPISNTYQLFPGLILTSHLCISYYRRNNQSQSTKQHRNTGHNRHCFNSHWKQHQFAQ